MSVQVRRRREAASFLASFVGAQGELIVDTTNNRVQVHDGSTAGGFAAAKLAEVVTNTRTAVADVAYNALASDRTIAVTSLTAARTITLPAASAYPTGTQLLIVDESGACSATNTITLSRTGTDTINGAASAVLALSYGYLALVSNGSSKWTIIDQSTASLAQQSASAVAITGGIINGTTIGGSTAAVGTFTNVNAANVSASTNVAASGSLIAVDRTGSANGNCQMYRSGGTAALFDSTFGDVLQLTSAGATTARGTLTVNGATTLASTLKLASYTVATLPAAGTAGRIVHCSNARMQTATAGTLETSGSGTGGLVSDNGSAWKIAGTNITASA